MLTKIKAANKRHKREHRRIQIRKNLKRRELRIERNNRQRERDEQKKRSVKDLTEADI